MLKSFKDVINPDTLEYDLLEKLDTNRMPAHIAVIMDGNGRWAKSRGMTRVEGHKVGAESARKITEYCVRLGIEHLTLFTFSSENWSRPVREINTLMEMLHKNLLTQKELLIKNNIRFSVLGELSRLPGKLRASISETIELSRDHTGMTLHLALNYGGRTEIIDAVKKIIDDGISSQKVNEKKFRKYLYNPDLPDPDLVIRTSGESRISNFLLYQIAYSELIFTDVLWPDFRLKELLGTLIGFQERDRRFGKV
ncbi:MAG: di-trans,poly-cis-decaprenylcistransferase [Candidatus Aminicenantes bacterium]|nr:di-trans,poly-cis-decaprenylcistransferase [Candidatus Aminicenantes bacterium]